ncbi:MAG: hypothetical protein SWK76_16570 [Actinomycetota bacterium]|nr:hypothetical protein [Actinomycetota bacterium]
MAWVYYDIHENVREVVREKDRIRCCIMSTGATCKSYDGADIGWWSRFAETVTDAWYDADSNIPPIITTQLAPLETEQDYERLNDAGFVAFGHDIEVRSDWQWPVTIPGKHKFIGREKWLKRMQIDTEVFGPVAINSEFVVGVIMATKPYGLEPDADVDKAVAETMEGFEWCWENGISYAPSIWSICSGSKPYKIGASQAPLEFYLKVALQYHKLFRKHMDNPESGVGVILARCYEDEVIGMDKNIADSYTPR